MFRHQGRSRKYEQNLGIASLLSFVAGLVNVVGFLAVQKLTTNVTGHFAFLVEEALKINFERAAYFFLYILFFFLGAFSSHFVIGITNKVNEKYTFIFPVLIEIAILTIIAFLNFDFIIHNPNLVACSLLFAMGLQNSLVTTISNSVVRTTHLTGLFTDMGIEFSQLFFTKNLRQREKLTSSIKLRLSIISSFFAGGIVAGFLFGYLQMKTLIVGSVTLLLGLVIDYVMVSMRWKKIHQKRYARAGLVKTGRK